MSIGKQLKTRPANMRHRILVRRRVLTPDDIGGQTESWQTRYASEPAAFEQVAGGEFLRGRKIDVQTSAIFTVNYRSGYTETDVIEFGGKTYGIVRLDTPEGIGRMLEIQAKVAT